MKTRHLLTLIAAGVLLIALVGCSDDDDCPVTEPPASTDAQFAGSTTCMGCHEAKYNEWVASGHPYKLTKINGVAPTESFPDHSFYPNDSVDPPNGLSWEDITYTIGGYGWKMRWIDENGWIVTSGAAEDLVQYNFETQAWVTYHGGPDGDEPGTKPYDCGKCHTTGWVANPDPTDLSGNQDGLPGMWGTFYAGGVHCEECHGKGSLHGDDPTNVHMLVDNSSAMCGRCHTRDSENRIASSGDYIKHHEQYDEWLHSPHNAIGGPGCNDCHDPHASVAFDAETPGDGMLITCVDCHDATEYEVDHSGLPTCTDCHMPEAAKSATISSVDNPYDADVTSHIVAINTAAVNRTDGMFTAEGDFVILVDDKAKITLDFACYGCHKDDEGKGGSFSAQTLAELSDKAEGIHPNAKKKAQLAAR